MVSSFVDEVSSFVEGSIDDLLVAFFPAPRSAAKCVPTVGVDARVRSPRFLARGLRQLVRGLTPVSVVGRSNAATVCRSRVHALLDERDRLHV
jgi:hypothetical protein